MHQIFPEAKASVIHKKDKTETGGGMTNLICACLVSVSAVLIAVFAATHSKHDICTEDMYMLSVHFCFNRPIPINSCGQSAEALLSQPLGFVIVVVIIISGSHRQECIVLLTANNHLRSSGCHHHYPHRSFHRS